MSRIHGLVLTAATLALAAGGACRGGPDDEAGATGSAGTEPAAVTTTESGTEVRPGTSAPEAPTDSVVTPGPDVMPVSERLDVERVAYPAPGGLGLVRIGDATWFGSSGSADLSGTPITEQTRFRIASITKPIVATLVLDAVERGLVSLDDRVDDVVPGVIRSDPPITLRMLLDHTSGLFNLDEGDPVADTAKLTDPTLIAEVAALTEGFEAGRPVVASDRLLLALAETHDRYFAPGDGFHYSNGNYQLAAMVLEAVTGETLPTLLRTRIAEPLGLRHTTIAPDDRTTPELHGYGTSIDDGSLVDITDELLSFGNGGNGGVLTTADELLTIFRALMAGDLIDPQLVTDMRQPTTISAGTYGLGLARYTLTCGVFYGHEGGVNGTASIALVDNEGSAGVVIALNLRNELDPLLPALADDLLCDRLEP